MVTEAAVQGHAEAQHQLSIWYHYAQGVTRDLDRAIELYTQAGRQEGKEARKRGAMVNKHG